MTNTENVQMYQGTESEIAYQNKDITAKYLTENLKGKTLKIYGLPKLKIVDILPTNLPTIEANELRIDNLLKFSDDSIGIIDKEFSRKVREEIMILNVIQYIIDDVKEETKEEVRVENEAWFAGVIRKKMEKGYDALAISDFLESPLADVESICDLIRANPDETDLQIAKKSLEVKKEGKTVVVVDK